MNKDYWLKYYSEHPMRPPSDFVKWCGEFLAALSDSPLAIVDAGCGDGTDSEYLAALGHAVTGIDYVLPPDAHGRNCVLARMDVLSMRYVCDVVYCRWLLHSLPKEKASEFLRLVSQGLRDGGTLMIECRSVKDSVEPGHYRRLINVDELREELESIGFSVGYCAESRGWSRVGDDDPLLIRIVAAKKYRD